MNKQQKQFLSPSSQQNMNNSTAMGSQPGGYNSAYNSIEAGYRPGSGMGYQHVSASKPANTSSLNTVKRFIKTKTQGPS